MPTPRVSNQSAPTSPLLFPPHLLPCSNTNCYSLNPHPHSTSNADKAPHLRLTPLIHFNFQAAPSGERSKADRPCRYEFAHFRSSVSLTAAAATDPFLQITSIYFSLPLVLFLLLFQFFSRASSSLRFVTELRSSTLKLQQQRRAQHVAAAQEGR